MTIEYKTLNDYPGYRFGSDGFIESNWDFHGNETGIWRKLKGYVGNHGYIKVSIKHKNRGIITMNVNVLILRAFKGEKPSLIHQCRHYNDIKTDNRIENLLWGDSDDNHKDCIRNKTQLRGENHPRANITEETAKRIKKGLLLGFKSIDIARKLNVPKYTVWQINSGETWKHIKNEDLDWTNPLDY